MTRSRARLGLAAVLLAGAFAIPADAEETVWAGKACNFQTTQLQPGRFEGSLRVGPVAVPGASSVTIRCQIVDGVTGMLVADSQPRQIQPLQVQQQAIAYNRQPSAGTFLRTYVTIVYTDGQITTYDANQPNCTNVGLTDTRGQNAITITRAGGRTIGIIDPGCF